MQERLRAASKQRLRAIIGDGVWWAEFYEMTFGEALGWLLFVLDKVEWIKRIAALPDPQEAVIGELADDSPLEWSGGPGGVFSEGDLLGCTMALQRNVLSIMLYRQSLCGLVEDARERADHDALFKAIRVDRSVVSCATAAMRISRAEALGEKDFFLRLKSAMKGPSQRHKFGMDLKYSLLVLREMGFSSLSDAQLERLFVKVQAGDLPCLDEFQHEGVVDAQ